MAPNMRAADTRTTILLKITGELFFGNAELSTDAKTQLRIFARQIKALTDTHFFGIVVGGGNFFRGSRHGAEYGLTPLISHHVGMLATVMNALMLQDVFMQEGISSEVLSAFDCPSVAITLSPQAMREARATGHCIIFAGGIGTPFVTTDTAAVIRGIQIDAEEIWKATKVDGVYTMDPQKNPQAERLTTVSYTEALEKKLAILDATAYVLAQEQRKKIRVFSFFTPNALIQAARDPHFGSMLYPI